MTDSGDELMKSYEVVRSVVARHSRYNAARILTLNLATCITEESKQDETVVLAHFADSIRTLCNAVTDMMNVGRPGCRPRVVEAQNTKARLSAAGSVTTRIGAHFQGSSSFRIALCSGKPSERVLTRIVICGCVCWFKYSQCECGG